MRERCEELANDLGPGARLAMRTGAPVVSASVVLKLNDAGAGRSAASPTTQDQRAQLSSVSDVAELKPLHRRAGERPALLRNANTLVPVGELEHAVVGAHPATRASEGGDLVADHEALGAAAADQHDRGREHDAASVAPSC